MVQRNPIVPRDRRQGIADRTRRQEEAGPWSTPRQVSLRGPRKRLAPHDAPRRSASRPPRVPPEPAELALEAAGWEPLVTARPGDPIFSVKEQMDRRGVDGVVIVHPGGIPVGSFGWEQMERVPLPLDVPREEMSVGPHARPSTVVFTPETAVREAVRVLPRGWLPVGPVRQNGELVGMVSRRRLDALLDRLAP
jgi:CBS domain-containing protein